MNPTLKHALERLRGKYKKEVKLKMLKAIKYLPLRDRGERDVRKYGRR